MSCASMDVGHVSLTVDAWTLKNATRLLGITNHMQINALIVCILCIYFYENGHKCMISWFKMIISMFKRTPSFESWRQAIIMVEDIDVVGH